MATKKDRPQNKNLIYDENRHKLTQEEQKMGGIASAKARKERKTLRERIETVLSLGYMGEGDLADRIRQINPDADFGDAVAIAQILMAAAGNKPSADWVRDTIGEMPKTQVGLETDKDINIVVKVME